MCPHNNRTSPTICYLKTETGELVITELKHQNKQQVRSFYEQFQGPVIVGLEASGYRVTINVVVCVAVRG